MLIFSILSDSICKTLFWSGSLFLAGGSGSNNTMAYSYNGCDWIGLGKSIFNNECRCFEFNGDIYVAGGFYNFAFAYSYEGINWIGITNSISSIFTIGCLSIAWNGSIFCAVGDNNLSSPYFTTATSYNGITWTGGNTTLLNVGYSICWNGNKYVAVGNKIIYSYDGFNWSLATGDTGTTYNKNTVIWDGNYFFVTKLLNFIEFKVLKVIVLEFHKFHFLLIYQYIDQHYSCKENIF